ncbi:DUF3800 domain-containing protein [Ferroacidibacillus organovorans]|uniref:DUF3800 domain-containing protein n=1 Tax=Ferroacidibacillus organovorans TaxID=1765683 RepID=A0A101XSV6_9BACL|nr:DUF3800 domain-containing protein [Ferroacidibacillus organovorans]KUO96952.1 hypothetical protein ATW55_12885 [Ferroacidibacillus organovorans]
MAIDSNHLIVNDRVFGVNKESEILQDEIDKEKRHERESELLLGKLVSGNMTNLTTRVAFILNQYPDTRNSDITLQIKYWEKFQNKLYNSGKFNVEDLYALERLTSITRARAKIQNEYKLFRPNDIIRRFRRDREECEREVQLYTRPEIPTVSIYCDESGKTSKYIMVGSVWIHDFEREAELRKHFITWKENRGLKSSDEFHFTQMSRHQLPLYKDFVEEVIKISDMMSFVLVVAERSQGNKIDDLVMELHYQLVLQGIDHEVAARRINFPRQINLFKDKEDGTDKLMVEKLRQLMVGGFNNYFQNKLQLALLDSLNSKFSVFIQIADLFTGCISRLMNQPEGNNHKDELAEHFTKLLKIRISGSNVSAENDLVTIHCF